MNTHDSSQEQCCTTILLYIEISFFFFFLNTSIAIKLELSNYLIESGFKYLDFYFSWFLQ